HAVSRAAPRGRPVRPPLERERDAPQPARRPGRAGLTDADLQRRRSRQGALAVLGAGIAWSTAGLAQRELGATAATQVAGRAAFATLALFALVVLVERRGTWRAFRTMGRWGLSLAVCLAVSSGSF